MAKVDPDVKFVYRPKGERKVQGLSIRKKLLNAVVATGASGHLDTRGMKKGSVQVSGTFVANIDIEGSNDGATLFEKMGTTITAPGMYDVPIYAENLRLNVTGHTSGTIDADAAALID